MNIKEAAKFLELTPAAIYQWVRQNKIRSVLIDGEKQVFVNEIQALKIDKLPEGKRLCTKCKIIKDMNEFYLRNNNKHRSICKYCCYLMTIDYAKNHREKRREIARKWASNNREKDKDLKLLAENKPKKCCTCKQFKKLSEFNKANKVCKICRSIYAKKWAQKNPDKMKKYREKSYNNDNPKKRRSKSLKHRYGINEEQYLNMIKIQNNKCAICKKEFGEINIDHDHKSNKVRELLCRHCNSGLGFFNDDIDIMKKAIEYIIKHNQILASSNSIVHLTEPVNIF